MIRLFHLMQYLIEIKIKINLGPCMSSLCTQPLGYTQPCTCGSLQWALAFLSIQSEWRVVISGFWVDGAVETTVQLKVVVPCEARVLILKLCLHLKSFICN